MDKRSYLSLLAGLGFSLTLFSSVFALTFVAKLLSQGRLRPLYLLGFTLAAWAFWWLTRYTVRSLSRLPESRPLERSAPKPRSSLEGQIILLAQATRGRLSASEVSAATHLNLDESRRVLEALIKRGVAELWVTDEGGLVYAFPEFLEGFKKSAESPQNR